MKTPIAIHYDRLNQVEKIVSVTDPRSIFGKCVTEYNFNCGHIESVRYLQNNVCYASLVFEDGRVNIANHIHAHIGSITANDWMTKCKNREALAKTSDEIIEKLSLDKRFTIV